MLDGPLPFELRPRKLAQLSGEATRKLAKLASAAGSREDRDEAVAWRAAVLRSQTYTDEALAAALRRFDLDGYGSVKLAVFECALEAVGVALDRGAAGRFFPSAVAAPPWVARHQPARFCCSTNSRRQEMPASNTSASML